MNKINKKEKIVSKIDEISKEILEIKYFIASGPIHYNIDKVIKRVNEIIDEMRGVIKDLREFRQMELW